MRNNEERASLNTSSKHLFRHLHDPRSLRKNPLVRRFFAYAEVWRTGGVTDQVALARIHDMVRQAADRCRDADLLEHQERRALHQHTIVVEECLARRSISAVADELGISLKHCYRQRAEICRRIARYIAQSDDKPLVQYTPDVDAFRIALDRVAHRCALIDARSAISECEELARDAPSPTQSVEALRLGAATALDFGDIQSLHAFYRAANRIYSENVSDGWSGRVTARACLDMIGSKMAYDRADGATAVGLAKRAAHGLESLRHSAPERIQELYVQSLYQAGAALCNTGDLDQSYQYFRAADAAVNRMAVCSARRRARVALSVWKIQMHLMPGSPTLHPAIERHRGLVSAFELAYSSGSLVEATFAAVALADHHGQGGNDDEALRSARLALALAAQQPSVRVREQTSIELAMILCKTRHWAFGASLLPTTPPQECDALHRAAAGYVAANRALRSRRYADAWVLASRQDGLNDFAALALSQRIIAANAAHRLGRRRDARALVEEIIAAAERLTEAPILRDAYRVAASVTGEARFKRRARELAHLLLQ